MRCLDSLQTQELDNFEIILVDNAADEDLRRKVLSFNQGARIGVTYVPEPNLGLHNARHTGARAAAGEILVFTDDDATFVPGWLVAYAKAFADHPEMAAAGGPVRPAWEASPPPWLLEFVRDSMSSRKTFGALSLMEPHEEFRLDANGYFFGVNMAIRRDVLFAMGGFNPDSFGTVWLGDGETGLNRKLWQQGMLVGYVPDAVVYHHISPERMTVEYMCRRMANEGASEMYHLFRQRGINVKSLLRGIVGAIYRGLPLWFLVLLFRGNTDRRMIKVKMEAARSWSHVVYICRLAFSAHFRSLVLRERWLD